MDILCYSTAQTYIASTACLRYCYHGLSLLLLVRLAYWFSNELDVSSYTTCVYTYVYTPL